jgi:hypothetical protein
MNLVFVASLLSTQREGKILVGSYQDIVSE